MNRLHMAKEAKHAAKMEKKLKVILAGYQVTMNSTCLHTINRIMSDISGNIFYLSLDIYVP